MTTFQGVRALVTGGASGLGRTTAQHLARQGATVVTLDRDENPAGDESILSTRADISDAQATNEAVATAIGHLGGLDVLVNCAGIGARGDITANDDQEWHRVLDVNIVGLVRVVRAALPALRLSDTAAIVNVASIAATAGLPQRALYSASKGAVLALTLAMAADFISERIRVNAVNPGTIDTPWVQRLLADSPDPVAQRRALELRQPHGRLVTAEEVAHAIAYLASPQSGSTTGTWLNVDGGMSGLRLPPPHR